VPTAARVVGGQHQVAAGVDQGRLLCACAPQSIKTAGWASWDTWRMMASVNNSQPLPEWLAGCPSSTVRQVLSKRTPFCAHFTRLPPGCGRAGKGVPRSRCSSLKILRSDGGKRHTWRHGKRQPSAWPRPWYGSCPRMTTRTADGRRQLQGPQRLRRKNAGPGLQALLQKAQQPCPAADWKKPSTRGCHPCATGQHRWIGGLQLPAGSPGVALPAWIRMSSGMDGGMAAPLVNQTGRLALHPGLARA
jgi:hypothetical protein